MEQELIKLIIQLFVIILFGFLAGKAKYLPESTPDVMAKLVIKITMPALILTNMVKDEFSYSELQNGLIIFIITMILLFFSSFVSALICKPFHCKKDISAPEHPGNTGYDSGYIEDPGNSE